MVSNRGNVKTVPMRITKTRNGHTFYIYLQEKTLKQRLGGYGKRYLTVDFISPKKQFLVHRLVLLSFIGPCPKGEEGCHYDGNPLNNELKNLRWDTSKANSLDMVRHGKGIGEAGTNTKLNEAAVLWIRENEGKIPRNELANDLGISISNISSILIKRSWKHI